MITRTHLATAATRPWLVTAGWIAIVAGASVTVSGVMTFRLARTAVIPFHPATSLVRRGPYRFTRNPMYLGLAVLYAGLTLVFDMAAPLAVAFRLSPAGSARQRTYSPTTLRPKTSAIPTTAPVARARHLFIWIANTMTTLGPSLTVTGDITSQEDIAVHGTVKGTITMQQGALVIAPAGKAEATVAGSTITVHGTVSGDLSATGKLELTDTAHVSGTITTPSLVLREGAVFNGLIDMATKKGAAKPAGPKLAAVEPAQKAS